MIKSYLIPYLVLEKEQETSVIQKANEFIVFKVGDVKFLDISKFLGGATTVDSFLKAYKASEPKIFPISGLINQTNLLFPNCHRIELSSAKKKKSNRLDKKFIDYEKLRKSGFDKQQALKKLEVMIVTPSGLDNYNYLREKWKKNGKTVFKYLAVVQ